MSRLEAVGRDRETVKAVQVIGNAGVCFLLVWALLCSMPASAKQDEVSQSPRKPHHLSSEVCKTCHAQIYGQWRASMHSQSTALADPIHGAFYRFVIGSPAEAGVKSKKGTFPVCLNCHAPSAALDQKTDLTAQAAYGEGVNCITCHTLTEYHGLNGPDGKLRYGVETYSFSEEALQAPSGMDYSAQPLGTSAPSDAFHPFPMQGNPMLKTSQACMGCHDQRVNFKGAPLCVTGQEYAKFGTFIACQSCHMPKVDGVTDHTMAGGHGPGMIRQALVFSMDARKTGDQIKAEVHLHNQLPHAFPTGAPFRNFYIKVTAYDENGNVVWQNFKTHPMKEDRKSMFVVLLGDEHDQIVPPPKATHVIADTRLQPNEKRTITYEIPAKGVKTVYAEALYNLVLPAQIEMLRKMEQEMPDLPPIGEDLLDPKPVAFAEVEL
jgi:hypothetical protein